MRTALTWGRLLSALPLCNSLLGAVAAQNTTNSTQGWPLHNDGLTSVVEWDHYSLLVNGQRLFVFSGEWHYWRLPVPEMWRDILEKIKASGANAFTFYAHWGYHAPNSTLLDFTSGAHDFTQLYTLAKEIGLYVLARPGPYVNAEANAGGFPLWLTTGAYGSLRNNDTRYTAAWGPYWSQFAKLTAPYLITNGGNVITYQIENEYGSQWTNVASKIPNLAAEAYMQNLENVARANGIDVPVTHNNPNLNSKAWSSYYGPGQMGNVDFDGIDSYPSCWTCDLPVCGNVVPYQTVNYYDYFAQVQADQPSFLPEFQGGSFNPWGGPQGGCPGNIGPDFANLFYRNNIGQRVTLMSLYMLYGGTNWGSLAAPVVATSYDYSSPISEDRSIGAKYYETKLLSMFTRVAHDLTVTDRKGLGTNYSTNANITASELRNPLNNAAFYVTIHAASTSGTYEAFKLRVNTSIGALTIPQQGGNIVLDGHQSKIIVTDFNFGGQRLIYSTAEVLTYSIVDGEPILVLWVPTGESAEFYLKTPGAAAATAQVSGCQGCRQAMVSTKAAALGSIVNIAAVSGQTVLTFGSVTVVVVDRPTAYLTWSPTLDANVSAPEDKTVIVSGPYLVRNASLSSNPRQIYINGDIGNATTLEVWTPASVKTVFWNGVKVASTRSKYGSLLANLNGPKIASVKLPSLNKWKVADNLPERATSYNDNSAAWVVADHNTTTNPTKPTTYPVLYVDDYGFHNGVHLFRGCFTGNATGATVKVQGGTAFGWSAWVNGQFVGSFLGSTASTSGTLNLSFANATISATQSNVLCIIQDNNGHDETSGALNPRGILQASLFRSPNGTQLNFTSWRIAGTAGGDANLIDEVRGALAEGGLAAERLGWTLPGFDDSAWPKNIPAGSALSFSGAGVKFYRTVVPLDIPAGLDVSLAFTLSAPQSQAIRVQLFVNGYQYGKFNPYIGHQIKFPVPPGVLNYDGDNVISLSIWNQLQATAEVDIQWTVDYIVDSSFDVKFDGDYLRPGWTAARLAYA